MSTALKPLRLNIQFFATQTQAATPESKPQKYYDKQLLTLLRHKMKMHHKFAQKRPMPRKSGDTVSFRKIVKLDPALTPLTEGVTPTGNSVSMTEITATTAQYGDYIEFSDLIDLTTVDPIIKSYIAELSDQANETLDILVRDELALGSNVFYSGSKTARADLVAGDVLTIRDIRKVLRFFEKNYVKPVAQGDYACLISPDTKFDIFDDPDFEKIQDYGGNVKPMLDNEIGRMFNTRFFMTPNAKVFEGATTAGDDVHSTIMFGRESYGITTIEGNGGVQSIIKALGSAGTNDPLNQRQTAGWKVNAFTAVRLNEIALARIEHVPSL